MKIVNADYVIMDRLDGEKILKKIERCGRTCYKSEDKITDESAKKFVTQLIKRGHESVLEHVSFSVRFIVNRGVSHQLVRHRLSSFSQESTKYCNYSLDRFDNEITVIRPFWACEDDAGFYRWKNACEEAERFYFELLSYGWTPEQARDVLPHSLKTEVVMTANLREWRHFLRLRTAPDAHPQMREVTTPLLVKLWELIPVVFDDSWCVIEKYCRQ